MPNMDSAHITFPTYTAYFLPTTSQQRQFCTSTTPFHTEIAETYVISGAEALLSMRDTLVGQLKFHRLTNGNLTSTSTTPTRSMGWISPPESAKADFPVTKTLKVWILCKSHSGSSCNQGLHNTWLRRVAYGRETFVLPFDNIGTTVFVAELVSQLRTRNVDLDACGQQR